MSRRAVANWCLTCRASWRIRTKTHKYVGLSGTTDPGTQQKVTANMLSADVLNVREFPTARFQLKTIEKLDRPSRHGLPQYRLLGDFTLQGVTRPIQVVAEVEQNSGWLHLRGGFTMLQSDFGMTPLYALLRCDRRGGFLADLGRSVDCSATHGHPASVSPRGE